MIPLFIVYGLSGAGKSSVVPQVDRGLGSGFNVYDMDCIVENNDYSQACRTWLRIAQSHARVGKHTVLFGSVADGHRKHALTPYELSECGEYRLFGPVHKLLLHCDDASRTQRLRARRWEENEIRRALALADDMLRAAQASRIPVIDTSHSPVPEVARHIRRWVLDNA